MIRILGIAPYQILPARTGGARYITGFYQALAAWCKLDVVSVKKNEIPDAAPPALPYSLHRFFSDSPTRYINPFYVLKLASFIRRNKIDVVLIEHPYMGWMARCLQILTGRPFVVHSHNIEANRFRTLGKSWWPILRAYEGWVHRSAAHSFFITQEDANWAIQAYKVAPELASVVTFGMEAPLINTALKESKRKTLLAKHNIAPNSIIYQFNGALGYPPNADAVRFIVEDILPHLQQLATQPFVILVCGGNLDESLVKAIDATNGKVIYTGFVESIEDYLIGSDMFINPVITGGGIKTKLVEALAYGLTTVSSKSGAIGVPEQVASPKLKIAADGDWETFAAKMLETADLQMPTPPKFYAYFNWADITKRAVIKMEQLLPKRN